MYYCIIYVVIPVVFTLFRAVTTDLFLEITDYLKDSLGIMAAPPAPASGTSDISQRYTRCANLIAATESALIEGAIAPSIFVENDFGETATAKIEFPDTYPGVVHPRGHLQLVHGKLLCITTSRKRRADALNDSEITCHCSNASTIHPPTSEVHLLMPSREVDDDVGTTCTAQPVAFTQDISKKSILQRITDMEERLAIEVHARHYAAMVTADEAALQKIRTRNVEIELAEERSKRFKLEGIISVLGGITTSAIEKMEKCRQQISESQVTNAALTVELAATVKTLRDRVVNIQAEQEMFFSTDKWTSADSATSLASDPAGNGGENDSFL